MMGVTGTGLAAYLSTPQVKAGRKRVVAETKRVLATAHRQLAGRGLTRVTPATLSRYRDLIDELERAAAALAEDWDAGLRGELESLERLKARTMRTKAAITRLEAANGAAAALIGADLSERLERFRGVLDQLGAFAARSAALATRLQTLDREIAELVAIARDEALVSACGRATGAIAAAQTAIETGARLSTRLGPDGIAATLDRILDPALGCGGSVGALRKGLHTVEAAIDCHETLGQAKPDAIAPLDALVATGCGPFETVAARAHKASIDAIAPAIERDWDRMLRDLRRQLEFLLKTAKEAKSAFDQASREASAAASCTTEAGPPGQSGGRTGAHI